MWSLPTFFVACSIPPVVAIMMVPRMFILQRTWLGLALLGLNGCSDSDRQLYPVRGIVRFTDGELLRDGTVEFEIMGREKPVTATAHINPDGSFVLGTYQLTDGALVGKHRVVVIADPKTGDDFERPWLIPEVKLHPKYRQFRTSGLEFEVKAQPNSFMIEVEYAPPKAE
jgi:hypothetical protein